METDNINTLEENKKSGNKLHIYYASFTLIISIILYFVILRSSDDGHSGGQGPLSALDGIVTFVFLVVASIFLIIQLVLFFIIKKEQQISLLNFFITLPLGVAILWCLKIVEVPNKYNAALFIAFAISNLAVYWASKYKQYKLIYVSFALVIITLLAAPYLYYKTKNDNKWWDTDTEIYAPNGQKILQADAKKDGIYYGSVTEWEPDGKLKSYIRYPNGSNNSCDSVAVFKNNELSETRYMFDSAGHRFMRENLYSHEPYQGFVLYSTTLIDLTANDVYLTEWYPDTKTLKTQIYDFDSIGTRYHREVHYKKNCAVARISTEEIQ